VTSLYVTHDQVEAMTLADRMIVMNAGVAEQVGAPLEVYGQPATTFVAGFIGSPPMNFLPAGAVRGAPGNLTVGIRPEHLRLCPEGQGIATGTVGYCEALGAETLAHLRLADATLAVVRLEGGAPVPATGTRLGIDCEARHLHYYDAAGRRAHA